MSDYKIGDKVKLTPKGDGGTVIYGMVDYVYTEVISVKYEHYPNPTNNFTLDHWNIEVIQPTTEDLLNAAANLSMARPPNDNYNPYVKLDDAWYLIEVNHYPLSTDAPTVANWIDHYNFTLIQPEEAS